MTETVTLCMCQHADSAGKASGSAANTISSLAGLDVLEEVLTAIGYRARTAMATEGVVGALARLITRKVQTELR